MLYNGNLVRHLRHSGAGISHSQEDLEWHIELRRLLNEEKTEKKFRKNFGAFKEICR